MKKKIVDMVYLKPNEIKAIKKEISEMERMLYEDQRSKTPKIMNPNEVKKDIAKKKKLLHDHVPIKLTGQKANKAYALAKKLEKYISENMVRKRDFYQKYPDPLSDKDLDFERAVKQQIMFQTNPNIQKAITAYKAIMQRLDPDNPEVSNIERLRR